VLIDDLTISRCERFKRLIIVLNSNIKIRITCDFFYCDVNEFCILAKNVLNAIKLIKFSNSFIIPMKKSFRHVFLQDCNNCFTCRLTMDNGDNNKLHQRVLLLNIYRMP